ncbi:hypothetical protein OSSY52_14520 [Tepiditoga spiralis]|uniref:Uncharacterized protein n=1 Tax=Tepiditoga spiralis TaxID=2108365 RepID=A0A7G1G4L2_9BACT|nr:hypothetical protein [Tepiditoga spiralis]BBE31311.1 hypothetical protein OSSY52_14520 [Tepiditoga spiralis]
MPLHDLQVLLTKEVDVANQVQAINSSTSSAKMVELVKQVQQFERNMKMVKDGEKSENNIIDDQKQKQSKQNKKEFNKKENNLKENEKEVIDEYRGHIIDLHL